MKSIEFYRQVLVDFESLCANGRQVCSFSEFCRSRGVDENQLRRNLKDEFRGVSHLPGFSFVKGRGEKGIGQKYRQVYGEFKNLCANGSQPGSFSGYCKSCGVDYQKMNYYLKDHGLRVEGLQGYVKPPGGSRDSRGRRSNRSDRGNRSRRSKRYDEVPFESVIFEEAGFLPAADANVITVSIDDHVAVSFPADTDVAVIAKFVKKMGKEAEHVES